MSTMYNTLLISTLFPFSFSALEAAAALGGEGLIPFYGLLEGGREGELFAELEDYFYYAQIRRSVCLRLFTDLSWNTFFFVMFSFKRLSYAIFSTCVRCGNIKLPLFSG